MKAPPPTPELWGSTSDSIACTAIAASTALPPRLRTLRPPSAASGLATITNGCVAFASAAAWGAGAAAQAVNPTHASAVTRLRNRRIARRLAQRPARVHERWRACRFALRGAALGEQGTRMERQLEHFENLVALFLARLDEKGAKPFLLAKR